MLHNCTRPLFLSLATYLRKVASLILPYNFIIVFFQVRVPLHPLLMHICNTFRNLISRGRENEFLVSQFFLVLFLFFFLRGQLDMFKVKGNLKVTGAAL